MKSLTILTGIVLICTNAFVARANAAGNPDQFRVYWQPGEPLSGVAAIYSPSASQPVQISGPTPEALGSGNLNYYGGPVDVGGTSADTIFWQPNGSWSTYNGYMKQFYNDIGNTGYYGNLTQYYDIENNSKVYILNSSLLYNSWQDTQAYPSGGYVDDSEAQAEVERAISHNAWDEWSGYQYTLYLGTNSSGSAENACDGSSCLANGGLCGWHNTFVYQGIWISYAVIPYGPGPSNGCAPHKSGSSTLYCPNGCNIDSPLNTASHETFEVTTDPEVNQHDGWVDSSGYEIGDKCLHYFDNLAYDGGQANHLFNGRNYALQDDYDNQVSNCTPYGPKYP